MDRQQQLRAQIAQLVAEYAEIAHAPKPFVAGETVLPPSGKVIGAPELKNMVEASLDGWLTTGRFNAAFEEPWPWSLSLHSPPPASAQKSNGAWTDGMSTLYWSRPKRLPSPSMTSPAATG